MSPHAISSPREEAVTEAGYLKKFAITDNGFLPSEAPLKCLSHPYYAPWERVIHNLPSLLESQKFHDQVRQLPVLSTTKLTSEAEWRRAYVILTFLNHGWVWGGDKAHEILPPAISIPLLSVSDHLELPPVTTYAGLNLWNFSSPITNFTDLDRLEVLHTFTGTRDEAWFYLVSVAMEAEGAQIVSSMLSALSVITSRDYDTVTGSLESLTGSIRKIGTLLERMYEKCDPMVFFYKIRPFLAGSKNMAAAGLPKGVFYDEGDGKGEWQQLRGGNNGQSSLIQFIDIVLGVEHISHGDSTPDTATRREKETQNKEPSTFHQQVREYMPGPHRRFLEHVARMGSIRELALVPPKTPEQERLRDAYQAATRTLTEFRNKHLQIVTRYIILPSKRGNNTETKTSQGHGDKVDLASVSKSTKDTTELTGTGGTALMPFLKQTRDETIQAGDLTKRT
ncbi:Indoleamine 2,3-dioxygenase [Daldinia childiae]|uniref:Indoleamine 2,3-dioxygenase n=1 Tax=Daldinia childiae TaxID=326645 RepID=UPI001446B4B5|nr:Indoleamine 2,3-dioxygenase [Daldinia childiae]KAF3062070.1 Indoleamine 2,3-dioxygenase [Daldinia childiae]